MDRLLEGVDYLPGLLCEYQLCILLRPLLAWTSHIEGVLFVISFIVASKSGLEIGVYRLMRFTPC